MTADDKWDALNSALQYYRPPCAGTFAYTADFRTDEQRADCEIKCARCSITDVCGAYASAAKADGFWAGIDRGPKTRTPRG